MTGQQLKASILQLAIQGKLVPQNPDDEPASLLLERIRKEKEKLIKEKKISADKNPSRIFRGVDGLFYEKIGKKEPVLIQDEIPFDIPERWEWIRLGTVFQHNTGKALNSSDNKGEKLKYITTSNVYWDHFELDNLKSMYFTDSEKEKCTIRKGDLLVCEGGDIGRATIWPFDYEICIQNHIHKLRPYGEVSVKFFYYLFYLYKYSGLIGGKGIGIQGLSSGAIHAILFPFPPLEEQKRIVNKLNEVLPIVDKYGEVEKELSDFNASFPKEMKKSILQYAIQGKLVPQNPEDEPASVLLERIRQEKKKLVKSGVIKKDKHESVIYKRDGSYFEKVDGKEKCIDDEIPFDIPESWEWVRLSNLITLISGQDMTTDRYNNKGKGIPYITGASNIENGDVIINRWTEYPKSEACFGDILLTCKGTVGTIAVLNEERVHIARQIMSIRPIEGIERSYIQVVLMSFVEKLKSIAKSMIPGISRGDVLSSLVSVPPISEQKRIVDKLETILPYLSFGLSAICSG